ncbi:MAG TPA: hypothetical protein VLA15_05320 [Desulfurivibrionaceae bacterium]|nr:hypothetical protein [Desulfurivibrionaceae bacterium]
MVKGLAQAVLGRLLGHVRPQQGHQALPAVGFGLASQVDEQGLDALGAEMAQRLAVVTGGERPKQLQ